MTSITSYTTHTVALPGVLGLALCLLAIVLLSPHSKSTASLPPGPKPESLLFGNAIPSKLPWHQLEKWTEEYGDIYTLRMGRQLLFVLGRATSAHQILEKQSAVSSDRPRLIMAGDLISDNRRILIMPYGPRWRKFRKAMHETLQDKAAKEYEPIQTKESRIAMLHLGRNPRSFQRIFRRYSASVVMQVTYDYQIKTLGDPLIRAVDDRLEALATWVRPGASILDRFPPLMYIPTFINPWKQEGLRLRALEQDLFLGQFLKVRERVSRGECQPCFVSKLLDRQAELDITDEECASMAGSLFGAGSDTTASALDVFVMAMCRFPAVLRQMQDEVDSVCGRDRLPTFDDLPSLPYVNAVVKETLRWRPISAGGFQHKLTEDVEYRGYVLPKGSAVVAPNWSIQLDPAEYKDPHRFNPSRFLGDDGEGSGTWFAPQRGSFAFGFGRRICPGLHVATRSLAINLACIAWCFNISETDGEIDTFAFTSAANSRPLPFGATFAYRDDMRRQIVEEENRDTGELERIGK